MKGVLAKIGLGFWRKKPTSAAAKISLQVMSDLHLEVGQQYTTFDFPVTAPYLILAGDIGRLADYDAYLEFLARQTARYERVFLVLGNHEFYGLDFATTHSEARRLESEPRLEGKLSVLQQTCVTLPDSGITILGCTLWSHVPADAEAVVASKINDFRRVDGWTVERHNAAHAADLAWLQAELADLGRSGDGRSVVVVTHHAPSVRETSRPEHLENPWTSAFATDLLSDERAWKLVACWVYGHTHYSAEFERAGVAVVSNQRGYVLPGRDGDKGFDASKVIAVAVE